VTFPGLPNPETLSLEAQVAQLLVVRASGFLFDHQRRYPQWELSPTELQRCIGELGVGGVILLGGSAVEVGLRSQQLQSWAQIPLLIAADVEEGVGQRFAGATHLPPPMALSAIAQHDLSLACQYAEQMGTATAQEAVAIGLNWLLAPVMDVNNNADNPVINVRAFGDSPATVGKLGQAFIRGAQAFPVLTTAKHFPGHGDTTVDSHLNLPTIAHDRTRLDAVELAPFRDAIAAEVDAVMTAHLQIPALDQTFPATLSPAVLSGLLREELGFGGLVVTDALGMAAIAQRYGAYEAAVLALEAGADILLMPSDPEGTLQAICEAVRVGRIAPERILASLERIWRAKQKVSDRLTVPPETCHAWEHVPPPPIQLEALATPTARQLIPQITQASMRVQGMIEPVAMGRSLVIVDDVLRTDWLTADVPAIALPLQQGYAPRLLDTASCSLSPSDPAVPQPPTLLQIFCRGNPFRGSAGLSEFALQWFRFLQDAGCLSGLVVYGSPYPFELLLSELPPNIPSGFAYGQMPEAQQVLLSSLFAETRVTSRAAFTD